MKKWTKKEEDYLRDNASQPKEFLSIQLNRSIDSVERKLRRLGVYQKKTIEITPSSVRDDINKIVEKQKESENAKRVKVLASELLKAEKERDAFISVGGVETYTIKSKKEFNGKSKATAIVLASDWHYEEPVKESQVNGLNKYDTVIAKERIEEFFRVTAQLIKIHQREYDIENLILALLGDFISGSIHDDLMESNSIQPTVAIYEVQCLIASGIKYLLKETDVNLVIPCSAGNHSRITEKQRVSTEFGNSLEILMYRQMKDYFESEPRVKFIINDSYLTYVNIGKFTIRLSHGHALKFSGGIGGLFIPAFKAISQWNKSKKADYDFFGHFHQMKDGSNFVTNGSLIGYSAYAVKIKADYEKPTQAFMILDAQRGLEVTRKITL